MEEVVRYMVSEEGQERKMEYIWVGDFNCHYPKWESTRNRHLYEKREDWEVCKRLVDIVVSFDMEMALLEAILQQFNPVPNIEVYILRSVDFVSEEDRMYHAYPVEFLQQLNTGGLPPALFCLKVGCSVILLRNLDPGEGLCNGTRMVVLNVRRKVLQCRNRRFQEKVVLIPRIRLSPNTDILSVPLKRLQFPVRLAFAMTINKSQGQSVEHVGINLQILVFFHGQLYVAFSRCTSPFNISVLLPEQSQESRRTLNVVYKEVFNTIRL